MTNIELELRDLAAFLDMPPTPPLAGAVRTRLARSRLRRRGLVLALATVGAALAVAFAVPGSRAALLRFLHIRGATVMLVDELPPVQSRGSLGRPIPLGNAPFRLLLPGGQRPDHVYADDGGYWLRYPGLLLFEFESDQGAYVIKKAALGTTDVEYVDVNGDPGIWIGGRHAVYLPGGPPRASGHALIWQHGSLTLRLEAAVSRERALAIARSVG